MGWTNGLDQWTLMNTKGGADRYLFHLWGGEGVGEGRSQGGWGWKHRNIDSNGISPQFEPTVSECKDGHIDICILKIMARAS